MSFIRKLFGRDRRKLRLDVELPVRVEACGEQKTCKTLDLSESGLRMDISELPSLSELTGGNRDVRLGIVISEDEDPVEILAEPIWTGKKEGGVHSSGWMFCEFMPGSKERLVKYIKSNSSS
jgi:hypothetical protein